MKRNLSDWASLAEIIGTVAVVLSLALVIRSIDQNTRAIEAAEANNLWQAWRETFQLPVINNAEFAAITVKASYSEPLNDVEQAQWDRYLSAQIDIWAQLFDLNRNDLISEDLWSYWDYAFSQGWNSNLARIWAENRFGYDARFQAHVDSSIQ